MEKFEPGEDYQLELKKLQINSIFAEYKIPISEYEEYIFRWSSEEFSIFGYLKYFVRRLSDMYLQEKNAHNVNYNEEFVKERKKALIDGVMLVLNQKNHKIKKNSKEYLDIINLIKDNKIKNLIFQKTQTL